MSQTLKNKMHELIIKPNVNKKYNIKPNGSFVLYLVDMLNTNTTTSIQIVLAKGAICTLHIYALSRGFNKTLNVLIDHSSHSTSNTIVKAFAAKQGKIKVNLVNKTPKTATKVTQNQSVDGILFDNSAQVNVTPAMLIDTNSIKASHAVNIGNINPEQLFYLMSRGLTKTKATIMILNGLFSVLNEHKTTQDLYNDVLKALRQIIKENHENKN
jgi:Fe-S cluster assembly protein SufD